MLPVRHTYCIYPNLRYLCPLPSFCLGSLGLRISLSLSLSLSLLKSLYVHRRRFPNSGAGGYPPAIFLSHLCRRHCHRQPSIIIITFLSPLALSTPSEISVGEGQQSLIKSKTRPPKMEGDTLSGLGNGAQLDSKALQTFQKSFMQVQNILDQNRLLINEINQNHESRIPDNLSRNVGLIRELNNNIRRVVDLYADLSQNLTRSMETSSEGDSSGAFKSDGKTTQKRNRPS